MMQGLHDIAAFLLPWEFSPLALALCAGAVVLYTRGVRRALGAGEHVGAARPIAFFTGWVLIYVVTQTHYDYVAQHMFFIHRLQHLMLHHLGPFLIVLARPIPLLARGMPQGMPARFTIMFWRHPATQRIYRSLQNPVVAPVLFVGLIFFWLTPSIHFDAMLSSRYYQVMNWSMLVDGLLFWALLLDPRDRHEGALLGFGPRIWITLLAIPPQLALGAYITFSKDDLFDVYGVCGRAWNIDPITDQMIGGLITWHPAAMMHVIAAIILIRRWMRSDRRKPAAHPPRPLYPSQS